MSVIGRLSYCWRWHDREPCDKLESAYNDPEHGDNGERLTNLRMWSEGKISTLKVRSK